MVGRVCSDPSSSVKFIAGSLFGFMCCYVWFSPRETSILPLSWISRNVSLGDPNAHNVGQEVQKLLERTGSSDYYAAFYKDEISLADRLKSKVRVLCFVLTQPKNHQTKARVVKKTWGPRCNTLLFMSSQEDKSLPTVVLPVKEGRNWLWRKTRESLKYVYEHYADQYDWVLKVDDDTYVIMENLRYLLSVYDPNEPLLLGERVISKIVRVKEGYMMGGAGYVLSKRAVEKFVKEGIPSKECHPNSTKGEDLELGRCMASIGVKFAESRDSLERGRFFQSAPEDEVILWSQRRNKWLHDVTYFKGMEKKDCSTTTISFHHVTPREMIMLDYLVYHLRPFGIKQSAGETSIVPGGANISTILKKLLS